MTETPKNLITRKAAADRAKVHPRTIDNWRAQGHLTTYRSRRYFVMIDPAELDRHTAAPAERMIP